jgi:hypothetical protein
MKKITLHHCEASSKVAILKAQKMIDLNSERP